MIWILLGLVLYLVLNLRKQKNYLVIFITKPDISEVAERKDVSIGWGLGYPIPVNEDGI